MPFINLFIPTAYAQNVAARDQAFKLLQAINEAILFPLVALLMAIALAYFLWGAFEFVKNASNESSRETGRQHMFFGTLGMLIMLSAFAILNIAAGTFGLGGELGQATTPDPGISETFTRPTSRPAGFLEENPGGDVEENPGGDVEENPGGDVEENPGPTSYEPILYESRVALMEQVAEELKSSDKTGAAAMLPSFEEVLRTNPQPVDVNFLKKNLEAMYLVGYISEDSYDKVQDRLEDL